MLLIRCWGEERYQLLGERYRLPGKGECYWSPGMGNATDYWGRGTLSCFVNASWVEITAPDWWSCHFLEGFTLPSLNHRKHFHIRSNVITSHATQSDMTFENSTQFAKSIYQIQSLIGQRCAPHATSISFVSKKLRSWSKLPSGRWIASVHSWRRFKRCSLEHVRRSPKQKLVFVCLCFYLLTCLLIYLFVYLYNPVSCQSAMIGLLLWPEMRASALLLTIYWL